MSEEAPEVSDNVEDWRAGTALEGDASFDKFKSVDDLGKSYREIEKYASGGIRIPTEETSKEAREEFLAKVSGIDGVMLAPEGYKPPPEEASGYEFSDIEGFTGDGSVEELKAESLRLGMTNAQADGIHKFLASNVVALDNARNEEMEQAMAQLRQDWGTAFEAKAQGVENTLNVLDQKIPGIKDFERTPDFVKLIDLVGDMLGEAGAVKQDPRVGMTREEAREKIHDIMNNPDHPAHPSHEGELGYYEARDAVMRLQRIASA